MKTVEPGADTEVAEVAVRLQDLHKSFRGHLGIGSKAAVNGLDLTVGRGQIFGLLGPNGAGKTTTIKLMIGLLRPDRGRVELLGGSPADSEIRARIGYLPENSYFYDHLTTAEFLDFYGRLQGIRSADRPRRVRETLDRVGMAASSETPLRKLSKGMLQRVGMAQAIQHDPELVILDEPMSGLDPVGRRDVRDLILDLRRTGKTVLFSSHILQDAEMICDHVGILKQGQLVSAGRLEQLVSGCVEEFEVSIVAPLPDPLPAELLSRDGTLCLLRVEDVDQLGRLFAAVREAGGAVRSVWPKRGTLEELFLSKVRGTAGHEGGRTP